jgi:hypothetical protein
VGRDKRFLHKLERSMECFYLTGKIFSDNVAHELNETKFYSSPNHCGTRGFCQTPEFVFQSSIETPRSVADL